MNNECSQVFKELERLNKRWSNQTFTMDQLFDEIQRLQSKYPGHECFEKIHMPNGQTLTEYAQWQLEQAYSSALPSTRPVLAREGQAVYHSFEEKPISPRLSSYEDLTQLPEEIQRFKRQCEKIPELTDQWERNYIEYLRFLDRTTQPANVPKTAKALTELRRMANTILGKERARKAIDMALQREEKK
jgi:hypothetical protein